VWLVERGWQEGRRRMLVGTVAGALQMLAGGPETILFTWLVLSALWIIEITGRYVSKRQPEGARPTLDKNPSI
jgi:hypothetical protein